MNEAELVHSIQASTQPLLLYFAYDLLKSAETSSEATEGLASTLRHLIDHTSISLESQIYFLNEFLILLKMSTK